ncbi:MAG: PQQ-binding-like beta-propeller repeat protein [Tepidisphaerales bacterium]
MTKTLFQLPVFTDSPAKVAWRRCCASTAAVAATFIVVVTGIMVGSVFREHDQGLLITKQIGELKKQFRADDTNEKIKNQIRDADDQLRQVYFARRAFWVRGAWLLLGGAIVLGVSLKLAADLGYRPFLPTGPVPAGPRLDTPMKVGLTLASLLLGAFFVGARLPGIRGMQFASLVLTHPQPGPQPGLVEPRPTAGTTQTVADDALLAKNWPMFLGPGGLARAIGKYPTQWDGAAGKNILWKTEIPLPGNNSPVVFENSVFLSGATEERREVYCLDATSGKIRWTTSVPKPATGKIKLDDNTGWAPCTMATDGKRVFAMFPTGDLTAIDADGRILWSKSFGVPRNQYGHASSLALAGGIVVVQYDQGADAKENLSILYGYDAATGKEAWKTPRPVRSSWTSPIVVPSAAGPQVVTSADPWVIGYDLKTGTELWRARGMTGDVTPSLAYENGVVYATMERSDLIAVKTDGKGDVTKTHSSKFEVDQLSDISTPLVLGGRALIGLSSSAKLTCVSTTDGKLLWEQDVKGGFHATPIGIGKLAYHTDASGITHIVEPADEFKQVAANPLGEPVNATAAFVGGKIYMRGEKNLYCIGEK